MVRSNQSDKAEPTADHVSTEGTAPDLPLPEYVPPWQPVPGRKVWDADKGEYVAVPTGE